MNWSDLHLITTSQSILSRPFVTCNIWIFNENSYGLSGFDSLNHDGLSICKTSTSKFPTFSVVHVTNIIFANGNLIYAQAIGAALMCLGHQRILRRYKGETSFGWAVASYIPLGLLLVGVGTWIEWAEYEVSYPLGTAIVGLSGLSMYTALQSNKAINFGVVSVV